MDLFRVFRWRFRSTVLGKEFTEFISECWFMDDENRPAASVRGHQCISPPYLQVSIGHPLEALAMFVILVAQVITTS